MAKIKIFMWEGTINSVLTDANEDVEIELIDAYTKRDYMSECSSDEAAAEKYKQKCLKNGFHETQNYEYGVYLDADEEESED